MKALKQLIARIAYVFMSKEKQQVIDTLQAYADAFMTFDPRNVMGYFDQPMMFLSDDGPAVFETDAEITQFVQKYMDHLQEENYATDDLSKFHLKTLTPDVAVTSFNLVRRNQQGEPFDRMGAMYTWRKRGGTWKCVIGVLLSH